MKEGKQQPVKDATLNDKNLIVPTAPMVKDLYNRWAGQGPKYRLEIIGRYGKHMTQGLFIPFRFCGQSLYLVRSKIVRFGWTTHNITWANIYMVIDPPMHGSIAWVNPDAINKIASRWQLALSVQHPVNHVSLQLVCSTHKGLAPLGHEEWGPPYVMLKCFAFFGLSFLLSLLGTLCRFRASICEAAGTPLVLSIWSSNACSHRRRSRDIRSGCFDPNEYSIRLTTSL